MRLPREGIRWKNMIFKIGYFGGFISFISLMMEATKTDPLIKREAAIITAFKFLVFGIINALIEVYFISNPEILVEKIASNPALQGISFLIIPK